MRTRPGCRPWFLTARTAAAAATFLIFSAVGSQAFAGRNPYAAGTLKEDQEFNDPLEPLNRKIFAFNMAADKAVFRPVAEGYRFVVHPTIRQMVRNVLHNLRAPGSMVNHLLQGDPEKAAYTFWGFIVNVTVGAGGVMNVMEASGVTVEREDFGQTLAVWGLPTGSYLILPLLGPSSGRDFLGQLADRAADPLTYYTGVAGAGALTATEAVTSRESALEATDELESAALFDLYAAYRSAYLQQRIQQIKE